MNYLKKSSKILTLLSLYRFIKNNYPISKADMSYYLRHSFSIKYIYKAIDEMEKKNIIRGEPSKYEEIVYFPNNEPTSDGLWLVNANTGELIRPKTTLDEFAGKIFYKKLPIGRTKFITIPEGTFELVNGFEYGAKTYQRDRLRRKHKRRLK